jgi:hypothetical protein
MEKTSFLHYCQKFSRKLYPALNLFYFGLRVANTQSFSADHEKKIAMMAKEHFFTLLKNKINPTKRTLYPT